MSTIRLDILITGVMMGVKMLIVDDDKAAADSAVLSADDDDGDCGGKQC